MVVNGQLNAVGSVLSMLIAIARHSSVHLIDFPFFQGAIVKFKHFPGQNGR